MIPSSWGGVYARSKPRRRFGGAGRKRRVVGKGFFGDLWSGVKSVASSVAPTLLPIATNLLAKRLGGRKRRVRKTRMGGLRSALMPVIHGMKKRRVHRKRGGGPIGSALGGILGGLLGFGKRRVHRRRVGGRRRVGVRRRLFA